MTKVLVRHHATFYTMVKSKMASVGHIGKLSIDHGPIIGWVYSMGIDASVLFEAPEEGFQKCRAAFGKLGKQPQTPP